MRRELALHLPRHGRLHRRKGLPDRIIVRLAVEEDGVIGVGRVGEQRHRRRQGEPGPPIPGRQRGRQRRALSRARPSGVERAAQDNPGAREHVAGQNGNGWRHGDGAKSLRPFCKRGKHAAGQGDRNPDEQQAVAMIEDAPQAIAEANQQQRAGDGVHHGRARQVVAWVGVAAHGEHFGMAAQVFPQRLVGAGLLDIIENADLLRAVEKGKRVAAVVDGQRRKGHQVEQSHQRQPHAGAPKAALHEQAIEHIERHRAHRHADR